MGIRTIGLIVTLVLGLLAAPLAADAQQAGKVYRIGFLMASDRSRASAFVEAFLQELRQHGWVEEQHFVMEYR